MELGFANARDNRKWQGWPKDRPKYLRFALAKANRETLWAINTLSKTVGVNAKAFSWAGTKDKRGVTTQLITAHMVPADKVARFNFSRAAGTNVRVGNFEYVANPLELGNLNVRFPLARSPIGSKLTRIRVTASQLCCERSLALMRLLRRRWHTCGTLAMSITLDCSASEPALSALT